MAEKCWMCRDFFGSPARGGLCSGCAKKKCSVPGCTNFGRTDKHMKGRCYSCHKKNVPLTGEGTSGSGGSSSGGKSKGNPKSAEVKDVVDAVVKLAKSSAEQKAQPELSLELGRCRDLLLDLLGLTTKPSQAQPAQIFAQLLNVEAEALAGGITLLMCVAPSITLQTFVLLAARNISHDVRAADLLLSALRSLQNAHRYEVLRKCVEKCVPRLFETASFSEGYEVIGEAIRCLEECLLGYQHSPDLFLRSSPALLGLLRHCRTLDEQQSKSDSTKTAASVKPELAVRARDWPLSLTMRLIRMIRCLEVQFSGYESVYSWIERNPFVPFAKLRDADTFRAKHLQALLSSARWEGGKILCVLEKKSSFRPFVKTWVESSWTVESHEGKEGTVTGRIVGDVLGRDIQGTFKYFTPNKSPGQGGAHTPSFWGNSRSLGVAGRVFDGKGLPAFSPATVQWLRSRFDAEAKSSTLAASVLSWCPDRRYLPNPPFQVGQEVLMRVRTDADGGETTSSRSLSFTKGRLLSRKQGMFIFKTTGKSGVWVQADSLFHVAAFLGTPTRRYSSSLLSTQLVGWNTVSATTRAAYSSDAKPDPDTADGLIRLLERQADALGPPSKSGVPVTTVCVLARKKPTDSVYTPAIWTADGFLPENLYPVRAEHTKKPVGTHRLLPTLRRSAVKPEEALISSNDPSHSGMLLVKARKKHKVTSEGRHYFEYLLQFWDGTQAWVPNVNNRILLSDPHSDTREAPGYRSGNLGEFEEGTLNGVHVRSTDDQRLESFTDHVFALFGGGASNGVLEGSWSPTGNSRVGQHFMRFHANDWSMCGGYVGARSRKGLLARSGEDAAHHTTPKGDCLSKLFGAMTPWVGVRVHPPLSRAARAFSWPAAVQMVQKKAFTYRLGDNKKGGFASIFLGGTLALDFEGLQPFSLECWLRVDTAPTSTQYLMSKCFVGMKGDPKKKQPSRMAPLLDCGGYCLTLEPDGSLRFNQLVCTAEKTVTVGQWHHVCATFDGFQGRIFVDGKQAARALLPRLRSSPILGLSIAETAMLPAPKDIKGCKSYRQTPPLRLLSEAYSSSVGASQFQALVTEVRVWREARTPSQITALARSRLGGAETHLVGYWPLVTVTGNLEDVSPLCHHAVPHVFMQANTPRPAPQEDTEGQEKEKEGESGDSAVLQLEQVSVNADFPVLEGFVSTLGEAAHHHSHSADGESKQEETKTKPDDVQEDPNSSQRQHLAQLSCKAPSFVVAGQAVWTHSEEEGDQIALKQGGLWYANPLNVSQGFCCEVSGAPSLDDSGTAGLSVVVAGGQVWSVMPAGAVEEGPVGRVLTSTATVSVSFCGEQVELTVRSFNLAGESSVVFRGCKTLSTDGMFSVRVRYDPVSESATEQNLPVYAARPQHADQLTVTVRAGGDSVSFVTHCSLSQLVCSSRTGEAMIGVTGVPQQNPVTVVQWSFQAHRLDMSQLDREDPKIARALSKLEAAQLKAMRQGQESDSATEKYQRRVQRARESALYGWVAQLTLVDSVVQRVLEFLAVGLVGSGFLKAWRSYERDTVLPLLRGACGARQLAFAVQQLCTVGLAVPGNSRDDMEKWGTELLMGGGKYITADSASIAGICEYLLRVEATLPSNAVSQYWGSSGRDDFRASLQQLRAVDRARRRQIVGARLLKQTLDKVEKNKDLQGENAIVAQLSQCMFVHALAAHEDAEGRALYYLSKNLRRALKHKERQKYTSLALCDRLRMEDDCAEEKGCSLCVLKVRRAVNGEASCVGYWGTSRGLLTLTDRGEFHGKRVLISCDRKLRHRRLSGIMRATGEKEHQLTGTWFDDAAKTATESKEESKDAVTTDPRARGQSISTTPSVDVNDMDPHLVSSLNGRCAVVKFTDNFRKVNVKFFGTQSDPEASSNSSSSNSNNDDKKKKKDIVWKGKLCEEEDRRIGFCGLVNLGNTCYQNSLVQAFFATHGFRKLIMSVPHLSTVQEFKRDVSVEERERVRLEGGLIEQNQGDRAIVHQFQVLLARMQMSQRSVLNSLPFKSILHFPFNGRKQHDCLSFAHYLLERIDTLFTPNWSRLQERSQQQQPEQQGDGRSRGRSTSLAKRNHRPLSVTDRIFNGRIRNILYCFGCHKARLVQTEEFNDLSVPMPTNTAPIVDLCVISGKSANQAPPAGFHRLNLSTNDFRKGAEHTYICVRRQTEAKEDAPITDVIVLNGERESGVLQQLPHGYQLVDGNLNTGGENRGRHIQLAYSRHEKGSPITDLTILSGFSSPKTPDGYEKVDCNLNLGGMSSGTGNGKYVYLFKKRALPIRHFSIIFASNRQKARSYAERNYPGYTMIPVDINPFSGCEFPNGVEADSREMYMFVTSGTNRAPITGIECRLGSQQPSEYEKRMRQLGAVQEDKLRFGRHRVIILSYRGDGSPLLMPQVYRAPNLPPVHGGHFHTTFDCTPSVDDTTVLSEEEKMYQAYMNSVKETGNSNTGNGKGAELKQGSGTNNDEHNSSEDGKNNNNSSPDSNDSNNNDDNNNNSESKGGKQPQDGDESSPWVEPEPEPAAPRSVPGRRPGPSTLSSHAWYMTRGGYNPLRFERRSLLQPLKSCWVVSGTYEGGGVVTGCVIEDRPDVRVDSLLLDGSDKQQPAEQVYPSVRGYGGWKERKVSQYQLMEWKGSMQEAKGQEFNARLFKNRSRGRWVGTRQSGRPAPTACSDESPILDIRVIGGGEVLPPGYFRVAGWLEQGGSSGTSGGRAVTESKIEADKRPADSPSSPGGKNGGAGCLQGDLDDGAVMYLCVQTLVSWSALQKADEARIGANDPERGLKLATIRSRTPPRPVRDIYVMYEGFEELPKGYERVMYTASAKDSTRAKTPANCNAGCNRAPINITFQRSKDVSGADLLRLMDPPPGLDKDWAASVKKSKVLRNIGLLRGKASAPSGWTRISSTAMGLNADLNCDLEGSNAFAASKSSLFLCFVGGNVAQALESAASVAKGGATSSQGLRREKWMRHPIEGTWGTTRTLENEGAGSKLNLDLTLEVKDRRVGYLVRGCYGSGGMVRIDGVLTRVVRDGKVHSWELFGRYDDPSLDGPGYINVTFDGCFGSFTGHRYINDKSFEFKGMKDDFITVSFLRDQFSRYENGKLVFEAPKVRHALQQVVNSYFAPRVLDGSNRPRCPTCSKKQAALQQACVSRLPPYLMLSVKRALIDYRTGSVSKILDTLELSPVISLPVIEPSGLDKDRSQPSRPAEGKAGGTEQGQTGGMPPIAPVVFSSMEEYRHVDGNLYGLYAVVIHTGNRLDAGHYFAFCRNSEADLSVADNPVEAPWRRFDDKRVTNVTWKSMCEQLNTSLRDTAYMFFFRRIDTDGQSGGASDSQEGKSGSHVDTLEHSHVLPELLRDVQNDNDTYMRDVRGQASAHVLQDLIGTVRQHCNFKDIFTVGATGVDHDVFKPRANRCEVCFAPQQADWHDDPGTEVRDCPFRGGAVVECKQCGMKITKGSAQAHCKLFHGSSDT